MGQDPDAIREDIAATREHMGETVDALVEKAHGSARVKQRLVAARGTLAGNPRSLASAAGTSAALVAGFVVMAARARRRGVRRSRRRQRGRARVRLVRRRLR